VGEKVQSEGGVKICFLISLDLTGPDVQSVKHIFLGYRENRGSHKIKKF
jgi:hypothetical protein